MSLRFFIAGNALEQLHVRRKDLAHAVEFMGKSKFSCLSP